MQKKLSRWISMLLTMSMMVQFVASAFAEETERTTDQENSSFYSTSVSSAFNSLKALGMGITLSTIEELIFDYSSVLAGQRAEATP